MYIQLELEGMEEKSLQTLRHVDRSPNQVINSLRIQLEAASALWPELARVEVVDSRTKPITANDPST